MDKIDKQVKVRFAPSPTGELHLGSARTALYNYLFAKKNKGKIFLRVEDTDQKRFVPGSMDRFFEDLKWLGINFDDEPVIQSARVERHREVADELVKIGAAYYELVLEDTVHGRKISDEEYQEGRTVYRGKDRDCTQRPDGRYVVRLKIPDGAIEFNDEVRGRVKFDLATIDDAVLLKSDGMPTYHLAAMVDDYDMKITHVLRGEEWLSSTPKHLLIYDAMGWERPIFVHLSFVLSTDGKKLSKRLHGESVWIRTYRDKGYLPEALVNYLALLGWNPGDDREFFVKDELIKEFSLERIHKAGAVFDAIKLNSFQNYYIKQLDIETLVKYLQPFCPSDLSSESLRKLATIFQPRLTHLSQFPDLIDYFIDLPNYEGQKLIFRKSSQDDTERGLSGLMAMLEVTEHKAWDKVENLNAILEKTVIDGNLTNGDVFWPVRVALTGQDQSPPPGECLWVLGKEESLSRIGTALQKLS